jgi:hypothetical protein
MKRDAAGGVPTMGRKVGKIPTVVAKSEEVVRSA